MENGSAGDSLPQPSRAGRILVLGAAGQLGRAAALTFLRGRLGGGEPGAGGRGVARCPGTEVIELDVRDTASVIEVARGADVVLNALNVPYTQWATARDAVRGNCDRGRP